MITRRNVLKGIASLPLLSTIPNAWARSTDDWELEILEASDLYLGEWRHPRSPLDICDGVVMRSRRGDNGRPNGLSACKWPNGVPNHPDMKFYLTEDIGLNKKKLERYNHNKIEYLYKNVNVEFRLSRKRHFYYADLELHGFMILNDCSSPHRAGRTPEHIVNCKGGTYETRLDGGRLVQNGSYSYLCRPGKHKKFGTNDEQGDAYLKKREIERIAYYKKTRGTEGGV